MTNTTPHRVTCRACRLEYVQFLHEHETVSAYCSPTCRNHVRNAKDKTAFPVIEPVRLSEDEYVQIAFKMRTISKPQAGYDRPKPQPTTQQRQPVRQPKRDPLDFRCPTKFKRTYQSVEAAQAFITETFPNDETIRPYHCPCGAIHIGHSTGGANHRR